MTETCRVVRFRSLTPRRASNARTAGLPGTGLGLSIVKVLTEMHGGHVSVELLELAWNDPMGIGPERVKFGIMRLRRKLGPRVSIEAVRGFGYRFVPPRA